jgi:hypothetical protein
MTGRFPARFQCGLRRGILTARPILKSGKTGALGRCRFEAQNRNPFHRFDILRL